MKNLRFAGILVFFTGSGLLAIDYAMIRYYGLYINKLLVGGIMIPLGLALIIYKGKDLTVEESRLRNRGDTKRLPYFRYMRQQAPVLHKVIWIISLIVGIVFIIFMKYRLNIF